MRIANAILDRGGKVRALVRSGSAGVKGLEALTARGASTATVDYTRHESLVAACRGASCVVSALSGLREVVVDAQTALLDAAVAAHVPRFIPSDYALDFTKLSAQARVERTLGPWAVRLRATGQYSPDLLPASEQLPLGGDDFGRAFPAALITGDEGAAASAEVGRTFKLKNPVVNSAELYSFVDGGRVRLRSRPELLLPGRTYDLSSTGLGVRLAVAKRALFDLEGARALQTPDVPGAAGDWRLIFAYRTLY